MLTIFYQDTFYLHYVGITTLREQYLELPRDDAVVSPLIGNTSKLTDVDGKCV